MKKIKKLYKDCDKILFFTSLILIIFGTLNIVTASSREAVANQDQTIFYYFYRQIAILIMSFVCFNFALSVKTKAYDKIVPILYFIVLGLNLYLILKGSVTRGAQNWIDLGFFKLQPSELAKPILIMTLAVVFENSYKNLINPNVDHKMSIGRILLIGVLIPLIVFFQKDLGTCIILTGIFGIMYLASPMSKKEKIRYILFACGIIIIGFLGVKSYTGHILSPAQSSRLDYFNPCSKYEQEGYQICNAFIAINNGGLTGLGIGKSTQKYSYIPEPHTDMVFAIIAEENGVLKCSLIFIAYLIILSRILILSSRTTNLKNKYICLGIATYIFLHILVNLGGLFGLIPLTGVPLPFLSYGGSFTLSLITSLGVIQRIYIENKNKKVI